MEAPRNWEWGGVASDTLRASSNLTSGIILQMLPLVEKWGVSGDGAGGGADPKQSGPIGLVQAHSNWFVLM